MKINFFVIAILLVFGCAPAQYSPTYPPVVPYKPSAKHQKPTISHQYELTVVDMDGNPLEGVTIEYTIKDSGKLINSRSFSTGKDGMLIVMMDATSDSTYKYINTYESEFSYVASKAGYYPQNGAMMSQYGQSGNTIANPIEKDKITLIKPIDYLTKEFALKLTDIELKKKVLRFIDLIILQGLTSESVLSHQSISIIQFKGKSYLKFKFTNVNVFNSLRLDKYDIGKRIFDDVIRKVLTPLNEYIGDTKLFYGYDLTVIGHTKSFVEKTAASKAIEYRFLTPEHIVKKYKNKDISGQQVLNDSIILMDDERIDLKLQ